MILCHVFNTPRLLWCKIAQGFLDLRSVPFLEGMCFYDKSGRSSRFLERHGPIAKMDETNKATVRVVVKGVRANYQ